MKAGVRSLKLEEIRTDGGIQCRAELDPDTVAEYTVLVQQKVKFPPVDVFFDSECYWLSEGFHRYAAHKAAPVTSIMCNIKPGTAFDAFQHAAGSNDTHGLRRTNEDKRHAVRLSLARKECEGWSDRRIAKMCGVTHPFVASIRSAENDGEPVGSSSGADVVKVETVTTSTTPPVITERQGNDGKMYPVDPETGRIEKEIYLTPDALALAICKRMFQRFARDNCPQPRRILEPSSGGGAFLRAMRATWPDARITACDLREECREHADKVEALFYAGNFVTELWTDKFDLICGNPPFLEAEEHRKRALQVLEPAGTLAFLLPVGFFGSKDRSETIWSNTDGTGFTPIYPRPAFFGGGSTDRMEYGLFEWEPGSHELGRLEPIIIWSKPLALVEGEAA